jgi:hypothetical protein
MRDISVTVYNENLGLVHEERTIAIPSGRSELRCDDVAAQLDPTSVHLVPADDGAFQVLEQNFQYDLINSDRLLERSLHAAVQVLGRHGEVVDGRLLSFDAGSLVLETRDGVKMLDRGQLRELSVPSLPGGLISRPTLSWLIECPSPGDRRTRLSYLTGGLSWHAEYVAVINAADDGLSLAGWVSIENRSGASYPDAKLKLVAGDVHRVAPRYGPERPGARMLMQMDAAAAPQFEERRFFEYHLYDLQRRTTIADLETKQVAFFEPAAVSRVQKQYKFDPWRGPKVSAAVEFKNTKESGLGMPLPAGTVRVYKQDEDGTAEFVGEDRIGHTPQDESMRLAVGNVFDVVAEIKAADYRRLSDSVTETAYEISVRNRKPEAITILVLEHPVGDWEILRPSHEYTRKDAFTVEFPVEAPAGGEVKVTYRVRTR